MDPIVKIRIENMKSSSIQTLDQYREFLEEELNWAKAEEARRKSLGITSSSPR